MILAILYNLYILSSMITLTSININGLNNSMKLEEVMVNFTTDILVLQETKWTQAKIPDIQKQYKGTLFANCGTDKSRGVAILVKENVGENITEIFNDGKGRMIVIEFDVNNVTFRLINVYAPNREREKREFFEALGVHCTGNCVLVGDFNVICTKLDTYRVDMFRQDSARKVLLQMMEEKRLIDVWRVGNATTREFSRRQVVEGVLKQSRIDLCLVLQDIANEISGIQHVFTGYSDHAALTFHLGDSQKGKGGGVWCLNTSVLAEKEYREMVKDCICEQMKCEMYEEDVCGWWECMKKLVKKLSMRYCKKRNRERRRRECELREKMAEELNQMEQNPNRNIGEYMEIKGKLETYEKDKCKGAIIRSKAQYAVEGEKCTAFFLGLEKRKQGRTYIAEIENEEGVVVNDYVGVLDTVQGFYSNLFKKGLSLIHI